jgi:hypothetical protein
VITWGDERRDKDKWQVDRETRRRGGGESWDKETGRQVDYPAESSNKLTYQVFFRLVRSSCFYMAKRTPFGLIGSRFTIWLIWRRGDRETWRQGEGEKGQLKRTKRVINWPTKFSFNLWGLLVFKKAQETNESSNKMTYQVFFRLVRSSCF